MLDINIEFASNADLNVQFHFGFMVSGLQRMSSNIQDMTGRLSIHDETLRNHIFNIFTQYPGRYLLKQK